MAPTGATPSGGAKKKPSAAPGVTPKVDPNKRLAQLKAELSSRKGLKALRKNMPQDETILRIYQNRDKLNIDPETLSFSNEAQLDNVVEVYKKLGVQETGTDLTEWMKEGLKFAYEGKPHSTDPTNPLNKLLRKNEFTDAELLQISNSSPEGEQFYLSYLYFDTVRGILRAQKVDQVEINEGLRGMNEEPVTATISKHASKAANKFVDAVENRDYSTLALYGVLGYGLYKFYEKNIKDKEDTTLGKFLIYGSAIYAGAAIFAPEKLKEIWGKGVNADIKGTSINSLADMAKMNPEAYRMGLETGVMLALSQAKAIDVFSPIATEHIAKTNGLDSDPKSAKFGMIQLTRPGIRQYFPHLEGIGPIYLDERPYNSLSAQEKLYVDACRQLYSTTLTLRDMYRNKVEAKGGTTFEEKFLNPKSQYAGVEMRGLYYLLSTYGSIESSGWLDSEAYDRARRELSAFDNAGLNIVNERADGQIAGYAFGFPIRIKMKRGEGETTYDIALANDPDTAVVIGYTVPDGATTNPDPGNKIDELYGAIEGQMTALLTGVHFNGSTNKLEFKDGKWAAEMAMKGYPALGVPAFDTEVECTPSDNARSVKCAIVGTTDVLYVDQDASPEANTVLYHVFNSSNSDLTPLKLLYNGSNAKLDYDPATGGNTFNVVMLGHSIEVTYDSGSGEYLITKEAFLELVKDPRFASKYIESRLNAVNAPVFEEIRQHIQANSDRENYVEHFARGAWDSITDFSLPSGGQLLSGSVNENEVDMLLNSRKFMLEAMMTNLLNDADTKAEFAEIEMLVQERILELEEFYNSRWSANKPKGDTWDREEFVIANVDPLRLVMFKTNSYKRAADKFEKEAVSEVVGSIHDLSQNPGQVAGRMMETFFLYTAHFDTYDLDDMTPEGTIPKETNQIEHYFKYVTKTIGTSAKTYLNTGGGSGKAHDLPAPKAWPGIKTFDRWLATEGAGKDFAVEAMDKRLALNEAGVKTELLRKYKGVIDSIKDEYPDSSKNVTAFFKREFKEKGRLNREILEIVAREDGTIRRRANQEYIMNEYARIFTKWCERTAREGYDSYFETLPWYEGLYERTKFVFK